MLTVMPEMKTDNISCTGKSGATRFSYIAGERVKWYKHFGKQCDNSLKLNIFLTCDPAVLIDVYPEKM